MDNSSILLYDDNPLNVRLLSMFLEESGFSAEICSYEEIFEKVSSGEYDAVFISISSSGINKAFIFKLSEFTKNIIILLSGGDVSEAKPYIQAGASAFITKPLNINNIKDAVYSLKKSIKTNCSESCDLKKLGEVLGISDESLLINIFRQYFSSAFDDLKKMSKALSCGNLEELRHLAHSLKGASRNLRLISVGDISEKLENAARQNDINCGYMIDDISDILKSLYNSFIEQYGE